MNKSDLVEVLARKTDITLKKSEDVVNTVFDVMSEALVSGGRIEIRGFGSFVNKSYRSYKGRNPKTKETIDIPPKRLPFFKVGKELRKRVNNGSAAGAA
jgi:integration host factor subunit beta